MRYELSVKQAAAMIGVCQTTIRAYIYKKHIRGRLTSTGKWMVSLESLEQLKYREEEEDSWLEEQARKVLAAARVKKKRGRPRKKS